MSPGRELDALIAGLAALKIVGYEFKKDAEEAHTQDL